MFVKFIYFISSLFFIISLIPDTENIINNSSETDDDYFINEMSEADYISQNTEPFHNFFNLNIENSTNNSYCDLCKNGLNILLNTLIQEYKWTYLHAFCTFGCSLKLRKDICHAAVGRYGPIVIENTLKRILNSESICTSMHICEPSFQYESIEDYAKRILKTNLNSINNDIINNIKNDNNIINFAQITDSHIQLDYQEGKVINCNIPLCCRDTPEQLGFKHNKNHKGQEIKYSLKYGAVGKCDGNLEVLKSLAKEIKHQNISFILFTGDFSAHDVWEIHQDDISKITQISVDLLSKEIGDGTPIYPAIGNHEKAPPDVFYGSETILLHGLSKAFKKYLTQEAYDDFSQYGYYTMLYKNTNLRLVSLNCILCNSMNFNLIGDSFQVAKMFKWLENVLNEAEKKGEKIYLLDHIPMYSSQHSYECSIRLKILLERYQHIISGYFSGHTHRDGITLVKEYQNNKKYSVINYICPSLTTYPELWPSYRIYHADLNSKLVYDYTQWRLDLDETNKNDKPKWYISYKASKFYNVSNMNDYDKISKANIDEKYVKMVYADNPEYDTNYKSQKIIEKVKCGFKSDNYKDFLKCNNVVLGAEYYLHYVVNVLFKKWPKIE